MLGALHQMLHITIELKNGAGLVGGGVRQNTPRVKTNGNRTYGILAAIPATPLPLLDSAIR